MRWKNPRLVCGTPTSRNVEWVGSKRLALNVELHLPPAKLVVVDQIIQEAKLWKKQGQVLWLEENNGFLLIATDNSLASPQDRMMRMCS